MPLYFKKALKKTRWRWFDYNKEEDAWESNEFYGKKHPMDMFIDGDIVEGLKVNP